MTESDATEVINNALQKRFARIDRVKRIEFYRVAEYRSKFLRGFTSSKVHQFPKKSETVRIYHTHFVYENFNRIK